jgi:hypothetical protein
MRTIAAVALVAAVLAGASALPACGPPGGGKGKGKWASHMGKVPFVVGHAKGAERGAAAGKPMLYLFTADW